MKRLLLIVSLLIFSISLVAAPIGEKRAREIATNFFATATRSGATPSLDLAWVGNDMEQNLLNSGTRSAQAGASDDALLYIYNRTDAVGFVIVAGDDNAKRGIVAFSFDNSFDTENMAEGAKAMLQAWCEDISEARNSKSVTTRATIIIDRGEVVREYETAKWGQGTPYNNECPIINGKRAKSGCVATAAAIVCYHHRWPEKAVGETQEYTVSKNNTVVPARVLGRTYDYDNMLMKYNNVNYTKEQADAVSAIIVDIGNSINIQYGDDSTGGNILRLARELAMKFGYSKEMFYIRRMSYENDDKWYEALRKNLDTCGPTYYRGTSASGTGHAFLLDGYTDTNYFHINYGWNGSSNGYYFLPNIGYFKEQRSIFNMYPDRDGTTQYLSSITTGSGFTSTATKYEVGKSFTCSLKIGNIGIAGFSGQYGVAHCNKDGAIKSVLATRQVSGTLGSGNMGSTKSFSCTITEAIQENDCLRVVYRDSDESEWNIAKRNDENCIDRIVMALSAKDVATSTVLEYSKRKKELSFSSPCAMQCQITDATGNVVATKETLANGTGTIALSNLPKGAYTCSFAASSTPYIMKINIPNYSNSLGDGVETDMNDLIITH